MVPSCVPWTPEVNGGQGGGGEGSRRKGGKDLVEVVVWGGCLVHGPKVRVRCSNPLCQPVWVNRLDFGEIPSEGPKIGERGLCKVPFSLCLTITVIFLF